MSPHFLRLRDHGLCDPDFARKKVSYRGKRSRRLCKILTFPLHEKEITVLMTGCQVRKVITSLITDIF